MIVGRRCTERRYTDVVAGPLAPGLMNGDSITKCRFQNEQCFRFKLGV